ncbi:hypothetical protein GCM10012275_63410 [Longimycelium tulufanense]|uniref:Uncharacterized protein n=1 Tax=Longimycelium tulufanense TaxID=907463 RepID=A0A8J3FZF0_9PSEU|nr:hypothetical protein GCM10012275_63410 [Longimycelium tulufanense]
MLMGGVKIAVVMAITAGLTVFGATTSSAEHSQRTKSEVQISEVRGGPNVAGCKYRFMTWWGLRGCSACPVKKCVRVKQWRQGHKEVFAIGSNHKVYRAREGARRWTSMGGWAKRYIVAYYWRNYPTVEVIGKDNRRWCSSWTGSRWQRWHLCAGA